MALMVWRFKPRESPESVWQLSPGCLGMVLKASGDFRVYYIKDEGQLCCTEEGGWALVEVRAEVVEVLDQVLGDFDK